MILYNESKDDSNDVINYFDDDFFASGIIYNLPLTARFWHMVDYHAREDLIADQAYNTPEKLGMVILSSEADLEYNSSPDLHYDIKHEGGKQVIDCSPPETLLRLFNHTDLQTRQSIAVTQNTLFSSDLASSMYSKICTVVLDANGGVDSSGNPITYESQNIQYGGHVINPIKAETDQPIKSGYIFNGWSTNKDGIGYWNFDTDIVEKNMKLYIRWNSICTVIFNSNGGTTIAPVEVGYNTLLKEPEPPVKTGYVFNGWYKDETLTKKWDFEFDFVKSDMTLYAKWE